MIGARLMVAEGRIERETERAEVPITHLICRKLIDRGDLLRQLRISENDRPGLMRHSDAPTKCDGPTPARRVRKSGYPPVETFVKGLGWCLRPSE